MLATLKSLFSSTQEKIQLKQIEDHVLYEFPTCPYCFRVNRALKNMGLQIESRNIHQSQQFASELMQGGGRTMVPCLRIENEKGVQWMYESSDIIAYFKQKFND